MGLQKYSNKKTPEELQFEIEQELLGVYPSYFERDKGIIMSVYLDIFNKTKLIPKFSDIEKKVAEYNYDVCYKVSVIEFETYYENDAVGSMMNSYGCTTTGELERHIDVRGVLMAEIDYLTGEMFNDLCSSRTREIEECIREILDSCEVVYEDDTDYNPICSEILFNRDEHMIVVNDAQLVMFPGLYADEYGYENNTIYDGCEYICNCIARRRRRVSDSRLLKNGGD